MQVCVWQAGANLQLLQLVRGEGQARQSMVQHDRAGGVRGVQCQRGQCTQRRAVTLVLPIPALTHA